MRIVEASGDFAAALASCQREAEGSFGNGAVLSEKYVQRPRHIEIQVFGDSQGNYVYLFERDCSVQRRHQKVLEEAPAPGMTEALRAQMGAAAVAAARAVSYVGAGTVEFIVEQASYDQPEAMEWSAAGPPQGATAPSGGSAAHEVASVGAFFFMEMNTRLQVEHPVTEAITGLDLVEWQLIVASGEPLPLRQDQLQIQGHAIEARICAETPDKQFLPATGTLGVYALPAHTSFARADYGVRVDSGVRQGDTISPYYDSMVAKLIVHGRTRAEALSRMDAALTQTHIVGLNTNVQFLRHVVASDAFAQARLDTALIPREAATLFDQEKVGLAWAGVALVADTLRLESAAAEAAGGWKDPWAARDSWQSHAAPVRSFALEFAGAPYSATLRPTRGGAAQLDCGGVNAALNFTVQANGSLDIAWGHERQRLQVYRQGETAHVFMAHGATQIVAVDALAHAAVAQADTGRLTAPMPGKLLSFAVMVGDVVRRGQPLAVMDAMKMEHTISAPADGRVEELLYAPGDQVAEGAELLRLAVAVVA
jgi:3-methylcrotonyl-CoA carboxylase alpha subunit